MAVPWCNRHWTFRLFLVTIRTLEIHLKAFYYGNLKTLFLHFSCLLLPSLNGGVWEWGVCGGVTLSLFPQSTFSPIPTSLPLLLPSDLHSSFPFEVSPFSGTSRPHPCLIEFHSTCVILYILLFEFCLLFVYVYSNVNSTRAEIILWFCFLLYPQCLEWAFAVWISNIYQRPFPQTREICCCRYLERAWEAEAKRTIKPNFRIKFRSKIFSTYDCSLTKLVLGHIAFEETFSNASLWGTKS